MKYLKKYENKQIYLEDLISPETYWYYQSDKVKSILHFKEKSGYGYFKFVILQLIDPLKLKTIEIFDLQIEDILSRIRPASKEEINLFKEEVEFHSEINKYNL